MQVIKALIRSSCFVITSQNLRVYRSATTTSNIQKVTVLLQSKATTN